MKKKSIQVYKQDFDSTIDKLRAYFTGENITLTDKEDEIRHRLECAFTLVCSFKSNEQAVKELVKQHGISKMQAYRDLRNSMELFGDVVKMKKEAQKYILYELAMRNYQLAALENPPNIDQLNRSVANLIKITGADRDDFDLPDPAKIQPPNQILSLEINFINSSFFDMIDPGIKQGLMKLVNEIKDLISNSQYAEYLDIFRDAGQKQLQPLDEH